MSTSFTRTCDRCSKSETVKQNEGVKDVVSIQMIRPGDSGHPLYSFDICKDCLLLLFGTWTMRRETEA